MGFNSGFIGLSATLNTVYVTPISRNKKTRRPYVCKSVTLRRFRETIVAECQQRTLSSMQSACAVLFVICGLSRSTIFSPHYYINTIFEKKKKFLNIQRFSTVSTTKHFSF